MPGAWLREDRVEQGEARASCRSDCRRICRTCLSEVWGDPPVDTYPVLYPTMWCPPAFQRYGAIPHVDPYWCSIRP